MSVLLSIKSFFATAFIFIFSFGQIFAPITAQITQSEDSFFEFWSAQDEFTRDYCVELKKMPAKEFKILNLTDVQLSAFDSYGEKGKIVKGTIDELVAKTEPDLITLTGDNAWSTTAYLWLIDLLDSYDIPWAPVMGNHDGQGCLSEFWCAYSLANAKNCLFKFGPKNMGYGNYIINVTESGNIIHTLFMMDTHSSIEEDNINGKKDSGYDHLWPNQLEWYKWAVKGIEKIAGHTVESSVLFHIPVVEYKDAWAGYNAGESIYEGNSFGDLKDDGIWSATENNGFFALCQKLGSTKNIICGHDHTNDFSILYNGIRLTYSVKTGPGCYWSEDMNGGTLLSVDSNGIGTIKHYYVSPDRYKV